MSKFSICTFCEKLIYTDSVNCHQADTIGLLYSLSLLSPIGKLLIHQNKGKEIEQEQDRRGEEKT